MREIPFNRRMTGIIHSLNHNRFIRVGNLDRTHYEDEGLITELTLDPTTDHNEFYGLTAGLYSVKFGPDEYIMDLPISLYEHEHLFIDSPFQAYTMGRARDLHVNLYKLIGQHDIADEYCLPDTLNNHMDMVFINGKTIMPTEEPNLQHPVEYVSLNDLTYRTTGPYDDQESELTVNIREPLRSMENGLKDLMVLNSDVERHHIVTKIGRSIMSGSDRFVDLRAYDNSETTVVFGYNQNVGYADDAGNIRCTHFKSFSCSDILNTSNTQNGIAVISEEVANSLGVYNGYIVRINKEELNHYSAAASTESSYKFGILVAKALTAKPVTVEYVMSNYSRRVLLLDEYHFKTFYNRTTFIPADNTTEVSYFYKTLHVE